MLEILKEILMPLKIYNLDEESLIFGELRSYIETVYNVFEQLKREDEEFWQCGCVAMTKKLNLPQTFNEIEQSADEWLIF
ncbi:MAG: hypothetical protein LBJ83_00990 [Oscillospiraceae bacterium]|nr:hypothetical protein [Oscillospiraceae bacterium]